MDKLIGGQGASELFALKRVLAGCVPTKLGCPHDTPGDAVTSAVQTAERTRQTLRARKQIFFRDKDVVHDDLARFRRTQGEFALDLWRREAFHAFLENEAANNAVFGLRPDDEYI